MDSTGPIQVKNGTHKQHEKAVELLRVMCEQQLRERGKRLPRRCVNKAGYCRVGVVNTFKEKERFYKDFYTSLVEIKIRWLLVVICAAYMTTWLIFACAWYITLRMHGDIIHYGEEDWVPCVTNIDSFAKAFLYSVETQHTTGYGYYHLTDACPHAMSLFCIQSIVGVMLEATVVGLLFVKMTCSKNRTATIAFSQNAVICQRDGKLTFMFRVADLRTKTHLFQSRVRAQVVRRKTTIEGEVIDLHQEDLKINSCNEKDGNVLLLWPTTVAHTIDHTSPLYQLQPSDLTLENEQFEVIVVLNGIAEATGLPVQAKTSYIPAEILWGRRFEELPSSKTGLTGERIIDFANFHKIVPVRTTYLSAAQLDAFRNK